MAERERDRSLSGRDIGTPPELNPELALTRELCDASLQVFLETCFPDAFDKPWSDDHLMVLQTMQLCIETEGLFALAMPRGNGKTTITIRAAVWAVLTQRWRFVSLIASTKPKAEKTLLKSIKTILYKNERLHALYPLETHGFPQLQNSSARADGQLYSGDSTGIEWGASRIAWPQFPGNPCGGSVISAFGITGGELRGQQHTLFSGEVLRPQGALLDDPQTRESAESNTMTDEREDIIEGDIQGMAGPDASVSCIMPCTVIKENDVADRYLSDDEHPEWHTVRTKLLYSLPSNEKLWEIYSERLAESHRMRKDISLATEFYLENREEMDAGAEVGWEHRFREKKGEVSALQMAMNLKLTNEATFAAEYQNKPLGLDNVSTIVVPAKTIVTRANGIKAGTVPRAADLLAASIDVHDNLHYWSVLSSPTRLAPHLVGRGTWPPQNEVYFRKDKAKKTLRRKYPGKGREGAIHAGLTDLVERLLNKTWVDEDGEEHHIGILLIDAGHENDLVRDFCKRSEFKARLQASKGDGIGPAKEPIGEYPKKRGRIGQEWYIPRKSRDLVIFDSYYWKTQQHLRLAMSIGDPGAFTLYGRPADHRMTADHLACETATETEGKGRTVWVWHQGNHAENHFLDCTTMASVGLSMLGVRVPGEKRRRSSRQQQSSARKSLEQLAQEVRQ